MREGARSFDARLAAPDVVFRFAGLVLLALAAWVPWATSRVAGSSAEPRLVDLSMARWVFVGCALCLVVVTLLELSGTGSGIWSVTAISAALIITVVPLLSLAFIELVTIWLSPDRLPDTLRRLSIGAKPMPGLWLTAGAGALVLVSATRSGAAATSWWGSLASQVRRRVPAAYATMLLLLALPILALARYGSWLEVSSSLTEWSVPGWALPWLGLATLALAVVGALVAAVASARPTVGAGVFLTIIGWLVSLASGAPIVVMASSPELRAPAWLTAHVADLSQRAQNATEGSPIDVGDSVHLDDLRVQLHAGHGALLFFAAGVAVMLAGWLVCRSATSRAER